MKRLISLCLLAAVLCLNTRAQQAETLFPYPQAPDSCSTLESRCNYIIQHFWDNFDITRPLPEQGKFETAFRDYVTFFRYANRNIVFASIRDFMFKARSNTNNLVRIGQTAEQALYSPYAEYWSDEVYLQFAKSMAETSTLKKDIRNYYKQQIKRIEHNQEGSIITDLEINLSDGEKTRLSELQAKGFLILFSDNSSESSIARLRLSTDININSLISSGQLAVIQVYLGRPDSDWAAAQPQNWTNAYSDQAAKQIDLRMLPCCYLLDGERKILNKNVDIEQLKQAIN